MAAVNALLATIVLQELNTLNLLHVLWVPIVLMVSFTNVQKEQQVMHFMASHSMIVKHVLRVHLAAVVQHHRRHVSKPIIAQQVLLIQVCLVLLEHLEDT